jgi:hypothetical protein
MNLRNEEATRDAIVGAIRKLATNPAIKENDPILIFYAGHGAEVKAPLGWPPNNATGLVQMLVPHDFVWSGSDSCIRGQGILDITLSQLLADLAKAKSDNIVSVFFLCCMQLLIYSPIDCYFGLLPLWFRYTEGQKR